MSNLTEMIVITWFLIFIALMECSRIGFKIVKSSFSTSKQTNKKSAPKPRTFDFQFDVSLSSLLAGAALTTAGYHFVENQSLKRKLIRSQLLLGAIKVNEIEGERFLFTDEKLFSDAVEGKRQDICLFLLKKGSIKPHFISETGDNLLVKMIENEMSQVLSFLLNNPLIDNEVRMAIDFMDDRSGKTPLLAAIQAKMYPVARRLLELGAKPVIPATSKYPTRTVEDLINPIKITDDGDDDDDNIEAKELLKDFSKLFKIFL